MKLKVELISSKSTALCYKFLYY